MNLLRPKNIAFALFMSSIPLMADSVELINGDRLSGTIRELEDGHLVLKSELIGTLRIKWTDIVSIETDSTYSILTDVGERLDGILSKREGEISVTRKGQKVASVDSPSVARIVPGTDSKRGPRLLKSLSGAVDIGYSLARGNQNQMQSSVGARAWYTSARHKFIARLDSIFSKQDEAPKQSRHALNSRLDRIMNARLFTYGLAGFERNERRRLDLRSRVGAGVGWHLKKSGRTDVALLGGMAYLHEQYRHEANRVSAEGFLGIEWETKLYKDVDFSTQLTLHPDVFDRNNLRAEFDSELRVPISGRLTYTVRLYDRFDTTPAEGIDRNDYGLVSGVGVTF